MFDDVSGFGAWHRRWCVLSGNKLCVWKYPDDETRKVTFSKLNYLLFIYCCFWFIYITYWIVCFKDPMAMIDLKRCITEKVGLVPRDICARPNTFEMVTVRQPLKGEHDTLVTKTYNSTTTVRWVHCIVSLTFLFTVVNIYQLCEGKKHVCKHNLCLFQTPDICWL